MEKFLLNEFMKKKAGIEPDQFQTLVSKKLVLNRHEAAALYSISLASLGRLVRSQTPPFTSTNIIRLGRRILFSTEGLLKFASGGGYEQPE